MNPYTEWRNQYFNYSMCAGSTEIETDGNVTISGVVKNNVGNTLVMYWAAAPAHRNASFSGSGMPYASAEMAFDRSPNVGAVKTNENGEFQFKIKYPSAYYAGLGSLYIPPQVHIKVCSDNNDVFDTVKLGEGIPFRTLTSPAPPGKRPRDSPLFYASKLPVRGQEEILRSSAYPCEHGIPDNFWGLKPPN